MTATSESNHPDSGWASPFRRFAIAAFVAPFLVFMLLLEVVRWFRVENSALPWWRQFPEHWGYPLQVVVCLALLWFWRRHYPAFSWRGAALGIAMGVVGIVLWLAPPVIHALSGVGGDEFLPWLAKVGFQPRLEGFDPGVFGPDASPGVFVLVIGFRFLRMVVVVALVEEIFWRGFLMRWLTDRSAEWNEIPIGKCDARAFWLTTLCFALAHAGPDFGVALIYGALAGWVTVRTGNLWAVVLMHATANLCLGLFIMATGWWGLW